METNELSDARSYYYDAAGMLTRRVDRNERGIQYDYDELNRVVEEAWFDDSSPAPTISVATTSEGGPVDEVQQVGFSDSFSMLMGGTFTLTYDGQTTSSIGYNATAATEEHGPRTSTDIHGFGRAHVIAIRENPCQSVAKKISARWLAAAKTPSPLAPG